MSLRKSKSRRVCSLAPEEGEDIVGAFLAGNSGFERRAVEAVELGGEAQFVTANGDLRTLPCHWRERGGIDGFYAARLRRKA
jgi:16S rRNA (cytosine967-C5)-methyltransferase